MFVTITHTHTHTHLHTLSLSLTPKNTHTQGVHLGQFIGWNQRDPRCRRRTRPWGFSPPLFLFSLFTGGNWKRSKAGKNINTQKNLFPSFSFADNEQGAENPGFSHSKPMSQESEDRNHPVVCRVCSKLCALACSSPPPFLSFKIPFGWRWNYPVVCRRLFLFFFWNRKRRTSFEEQVKKKRKELLFFLYFSTLFTHGVLFSFSLLFSGRASMRSIMTTVHILYIYIHCLTVHEFLYIYSFSFFFFFSGRASMRTIMTRVLQNRKWSTPSPTTSRQVKETYYRSKRDLLSK